MANMHISVLCCSEQRRGCVLLGCHVTCRHVVLFLLEISFSYCATDCLGLCISCDIPVIVLKIIAFLSSYSIVCSGICTPFMKLLLELQLYPFLLFLSFIWSITRCILMKIFLAAILQPSFHDEEMFCIWISMAQCGLRRWITINSFILLFPQSR